MEYDEKIVSDHELKSKNAKWNEQLERIPKLAVSSLPVLILGPSGVGKDILSQNIHKLSLRRYGPAVSVNCSALTEGLAESELFGHIKGSFTGATQDRKGAFESAKMGTLILDEIGDLPINLQPKLLRALENREIKPVGSDKIIKTDVRIIACTHQDLRSKVEHGLFRLDLFYRLNVIQIQVPPLARRMEDFEKILFKFAKEIGIKFSFDAIQELKNHTWPGNIRELKNLVSRAKIYYDGRTITKIQVKDLIESPIERAIKLSKATDLSQYGDGNIMKEIEKRLIKERLIVNGGNQSRTAQDLGIPKSTLNDRIKKYRINVDTLLKETWSEIMVSGVGS